MLKKLFNGLLLVAGLSSPLLAASQVYIPSTTTANSNLVINIGSGTITNFRANAATFTNVTLGNIGPFSVSSASITSAYIANVISTTNVINVKNYGATGNGVTYDNAAIQNAINALPTLGGAIFLPAGYYNFNSSVTIPIGKRVDIYGEGANSVLYSTQSIGRFLYFEGDNPAYGPTPQEVTLHDFAIHLTTHVAAPDLVYGIDADWRHFMDIHNVTFGLHLGAGTHVTLASQLVGIKSNNFNNGNIHNNYFTQVNSGIQLGSDVDDVQITNNNANYLSNYLINLGSCDKVIVANNNVEECKNTAGIYIHNCQFVTVTGNSSTENYGQFGMRLENSSYSIISGNILSNNNLPRITGIPFTNGAGLVLMNSSVGNYIIGNDFGNYDQVGSYQNYGVWVASGESVNNVFIGNNYRSTFSSFTAVVDASSGTSHLAQSIISDSITGMKNRLINGDMFIDQRNNGAFVTADTAGKYVSDRWRINRNNSASIRAQRIDTTPPAGFSTYLHIEVNTAGSVSASDLVYFKQSIEANLIADWKPGTPEATTNTLSFYVRCSSAGDFGGALRASGVSYPFVYNIASQNVWEKKTITIPGDTANVWVTSGTTLGLQMTFDLGSGDTFRGTIINSWQAGTNFTGSTNTVRLSTVVNSTFDITGVQLETGRVATTFDRRPLATEIEYCQRWYQKTFNISTAAVQNSGSPDGAVTYIVTSTNSSGGYWAFATPMRAQPGVTFYNPNAANANWRNVTDGADSGAATAVSISERGVFIKNAQVVGDVPGKTVIIHADASSEF